jgi:hypothetical protein
MARFLLINLNQFKVGNALNNLQSSEEEETAHNVFTHPSGANPEGLPANEPSKYFILNAV